VCGREDADLVVEVCEGSVYATLVERAEAARAELVVVGCCGTNQPDTELGEVALQVVRYAHAPVLVARECADGGPVVAATDISDPALPAVVAAARVAARRGVRLEVVHAFDLPIEPVAIPEAVMFLPAPTEEQRAQLRELARQRLLGELARCGVTAEPVLLDGPAAPSVLARVAEVSASLLVVATRGRTGLSRVLLGSTAEALVRGAACPVLAVRLAPSPV
jgi:nucleotide-binding universal stress UspA family protein